MKTLLQIVGLCLFCSFSFGQSISLSVVSSCGDYFKNNDIEVSWNVGEVITDTYSNGQSNSFAQGFEQPVFRKKEAAIVHSVFSVFPNPTYGQVHFGFPKKDNYTIRCYDVLGKLLIDEKAYTNDHYSDLSLFAQACYLFYIENEAGDVKYFVKIVKLD